MTIKIENGLILTMDSHKTVIKGGDVYIKDNQVADICKTNEKSDRVDKVDTVIDATDKLVMPGFVNVHSHLQQYFRGVYELIGDFYKVNLPLESYRHPDDMNDLGAASCAELIYGGCTTTMNIYTYPSGFAEAVKQAGNRVVLGVDIEEVDLNLLRDGVYKYLPDKGLRAYERAVDLFSEWHGKANGRITTVMAPKAADLTTPDTYLKCKKFANDNGIRITTHLAQSKREMSQVEKLYGKTPTQHLFDLSIMDDQFTGAHCSFITEEDLRLIKSTGMGILHCRAVSNPFYEWYNSGIPLGLGTDDYYHDMLGLIRENISGQKKLAEGSLLSTAKKGLSHYQLLELATIKGAQVLGMDKEIGSIEVNKKADLIIADLRSPFISPTKDPVTSFVLYGSAADIKTVIVDGKVLKREGKLTTINIDDAIKSAQRKTDQIIDRFFSDYPELFDAWKTKLDYEWS